MLAFSACFICIGLNHTAAAVAVKGFQSSAVRLLSCCSAGVGPLLGCAGSAVVALMPYCYRAQAHHAAS